MGSKFVFSHYFGYRLLGLQQLVACTTVQAVIETCVYWRLAGETEIIEVSLCY